MTDLERFYACLEYRPVDRRPFWTWGAWPETLQRWEGEGHAAELEALHRRYGDRKLKYGGWFFPCPPFEKKIISEEAEHLVYINEEGITMRELKHNPRSSMPQFLSFPVEDRAQFRRFWRERMNPDLNLRLGDGWPEKLRAIRAANEPLFIFSDRWGGFFGPLRNLLGVERLCTLFYDDPAFLEEMMEADADFIIAVMEQVLSAITIDAFAFWEDMAYRHGPLLSPALARKYMLPRYRRVVDFLRGRGVKFIGLDSDGRIDGLIPVWLEAGLNFLFPFEVQSGMDVNAVRREYGRELLIWGGVDKRALAMDRPRIEAELARLRPLIEAGGYIPFTDHSLPPDVPFDNYRYYLERLDAVCGKV